MKYFKPIAILFIMTSLSFITATEKAVDNSSGYKMKTGNPVEGFVVLELFTSEGCSSCPPADELVARMQEENNDKPVYILAFHVDYWNSFGWKDPFSSAAYSKRQDQYASWLNLRSIYTPQVVVNGRTEFIGSDQGKMRNAIQSGLNGKSTALLTLRIAQKKY